MSFQEDIAQDTQHSAVGNVVNLYELDLTDIGSDQVLHFTEYVNDDYTAIYFNGTEYTPIQMESEGWEVTGQETLPRPKVRFSNVLLTFASYVYTFDDLIGAKLTRRRTFEKYLDGNSDPNPVAQFSPDIYRIRQKTMHNKSYIEFELSPFMDFEKTQIPRRQIIRDFCRWKYRIINPSTSDFTYVKATCPYEGQYSYTRLGQYTTDKTEDFCGKMLTDCEMRFAGNRAAFLEAPNTVSIQTTAPVAPIKGDMWLNTATYPNVWYTWVVPETAGPYWGETKPQPLPFSGFPSVARFRF
jgi:lambda family phage minor tail protein L